jgi:glyoxylase-like metal-dependent hydrolase (beta-lactamase superfamily II)
VARQIPLDDGARAGVERDDVYIVTPDVSYRRLGIVNVVFCGVAGAPGRFMLVDAGVAGTADPIRSSAEKRFGKNARPAGIILTHGHFDHVGALETLVEAWNVPIYAHPMEMPYLTGEAAYPDPDPTVGGGLMAALSAFYPKGPIDVARWLRPLPADGTIPELPDWRWIHTPGHTPGHISLWRDKDRTLIAGDAVITTNQESAYAVALQRAEMHGPPAYFTPDWETAQRSVHQLAELDPELIVSGHGHAMQGPSMRAALHLLDQHFEEVAVPEQGRYVRPSSDRSGD